jgi:hypothetical protein
MLTLRFHFSFITGCRKVTHTLISLTDRVAFLGRTTLGERVIREGHVLSAHCLYTTLSTPLSPRPKHNIHAREGKCQLANELSCFEPSTWYCTVLQSTDGTFYRYVRFWSSWEDDDHIGFEVHTDVTIKYLLGYNVVCSCRSSQKLRKTCLTSLTTGPSSQMSMNFYLTTRRHIPEDSITRSHSCENLKYSIY